MLRAIRAVAPAEREGRALIDTVILDYAQRSTQGITVTGTKGGQYVIALRGPARLRGDDVLELEDGRCIEVVAKAEPLVEARHTDVATLARLAWQLGDRHVPMQVLRNRIRARRDPLVEAVFAASDAKVMPIEAPFEPEGGAYSLADDHKHAHDHGHRH